MRGEGSPTFKPCRGAGRGYDRKSQGPPSAEGMGFFCPRQLCWAVPSHTAGGIPTNTPTWDIGLCTLPPRAPPMHCFRGPCGIHPLRPSTFHPLHTVRALPGNMRCGLPTGVTDVRTPVACAGLDLSAKLCTYTWLRFCLSQGDAADRLLAAAHLASLIAAMSPGGFIFMGAAAHDSFMQEDVANNYAMRHIGQLSVSGNDSEQVRSSCLNADSQSSLSLRSQPVFGASVVL